MKVLLRADASPVQGTGHVMRCLTLAEELVRRGHDVHLLTNQSGVDWLETVMTESGIPIHRTAQHSISVSEIALIDPDWVVADSYEIDAAQISALRSMCSVMAIVDGDDRGIDADLYLDHNLGAEFGTWRDVTRSRLLAGNEFALIREAVLRQRRPQPWLVRAAVPHVVAVMGGSDPTGTIVTVAAALARVDVDFSATIVVGEQWRTAVEETLADKARFRILFPTTELPKILGEADVAVSAAGTSAWELCTLGTPSVLIAVVENQRESLGRLAENGLVAGLDLLTEDYEDYEAKIAENVSFLLRENSERQRLSQRCLQSYDGLGKNRVVAAMEGAGAL
jgi:UDP-2,4-diacetamido-2,4,6-trideoxy-beta-L-altropyranose hydrolase